MDSRRSNVWRSVDWFTILIYFLLVVAGLFTICGACYQYDSNGWFDLAGRPGSQLMWMGLSLGLIFITLMLEDDFYDVFAYLIYAAIIALLVLTIFIAPDIKGSGSWLVIGSFRLQPAELAKFATALAVAKRMNTYGFQLSNPRHFASVLALILLPMGCIIAQKETGSALVYLAFFLMLYREGMSGYFLLAGICAVLYFVVGMKYADLVIAVTPMGKLLVSAMIYIITLWLIRIIRYDKWVMRVILIATAAAFLGGYLASFYMPVNYAWIAVGLLVAMMLYLLFLSLYHWVAQYLIIAFFILSSLVFTFSVDYVFNNMLMPHQRARIELILGLREDPRGIGYNVNQSKIAIGSGGLIGKGFLQGTQTKLNYVPEQETDFIFCTVGEEEGFVGSALVLILFGIFIIRLIVLSERQHSTFNRVYGYSVVSIFFFHVLINIGMVTGLTPVIGIPLPFFSYGGSSLWGFTILLFIFLRLDASRRDHY